MKKSLLGGVAALCLLVGACSPTSNGGSAVATINNLTAQATQDVQTLAAGLPAIVAALTAAGTMTATQASSVQTGVVQAVSAAQTLAGMPSIPANASALQQFEAGINDVLAIAAVVAPAVPAVQAAEIIVPLIEVGANIVVPQVQALVAPGAGMTPDQARAVLRGARR